MDGKVKAALVVLGLDENGKLPKFKHITKKYHKLAMLHHPDRPGVDGEFFKEISEAYRLLGEIFEEHRNVGNKEKSFDFEEEVARQTFHQFQSSKVKENMRSFTILIENSSSSAWEEILSKHYGVPADRENNGLHWKVENYTDGNMTGNISIGKWHKPKKDNQSKLHIQSNEKGNLLPAHYVHHVLPKLFEEVQACQTLPRQDAPRVAVTSKQVKSKQAASKCKECDFDGRSVSGLNAHMKTTHRNKTKTSILKSTQSLGIDHSISVEDFSAKFDMEESTDASIHVQESAKKNDGGSILQESEFKESLDTSTHVEERTCDGSSILQEENPAQPSPEKSDDPEKRSKQETVRNHENISIPREDNEENTSVKREASKENISVNGLDNDAEGLVEGNGQPSGSTSSQKPQIKIPSNEIKPRKMQQRPKPLGFACKYCEKKFSTVTQLTSHMKACHTKVDDGGNGQRTYGELSVINSETFLLSLLNMWKWI